MSPCPSDLELESMLQSPERATAHLFGCPACAARIAEMRRLGEEFERDVFPATFEAVLSGARRPRARRPAVWLAPLAAIAAALLLVVVARRAAPPEGYLGTKGAPLTLVAYAGTPSGARPLAEGDAVPAGAGLRFEVRPAAACHLWIVSIDAAGEVSRVFPADGERGAALQGARPAILPGGAILDGRSGPERFFAVCGARAPIPYAEVERAARAIGPGDAAVRTATRLPGLPADAVQATLLLEKRR